MTDIKSVSGKVAFLCIDMQNDFMPEGKITVNGVEHTFSQGSLAVEGALSLVERINDFLENNPNMLCYSSQDWHPANHKSFASNHEGGKVFDLIELNGLPQVLWPDHCIQFSKGAEFVAGLTERAFHKIIQKGMNPEVDSYSAFYDNGGQNPSGLHEQLQAEGVTELEVGGVATDYCVRFTVLDALKLGYKVTVRLDLTAGVTPDTTAAAIEEMRNAGAVILETAQMVC